MTFGDTVNPNSVPSGTVVTGLVCDELASIGLALIGPVLPELASIGFALI